MPRCSCILVILAHVAAAPATAADCGAASYTVRSDRSFGTALADVRDLDGDGVNEYAAGSPAEPDEAGLVPIVSGRRQVPLFTIPEEGVGGAFGHSIALISFQAGAGPGEAVSFLAVGAPCVDGRRGRVIVYRITSLGWSEVLHVDGESPGELLGYSIASIAAGPVRLLAIGAPGSDKELAGAGRVLVIDATGTVRAESFGAAANEGYGRSVASAGDLNGDGREDLVVGSQDFRENGATRGAVSLWRAGSDIVIRIPGQTDEELGFAVLGGADLDGDGFEDVLASACGIKPPRPCSPAEPAGLTTFPGKVYVLRGGVEPEIGGGTLGTIAREQAGEQQGAAFGASLALLQDLDGDGVREFAVGAPFAPSASGPRAGGIRVVNGRIGAFQLSIDGARPGDRLGRSLATVGDLDGDGSRDLLAGRLRDGGEVSIFSLADGDEDGVRDVCEPCSAPIDLAPGSEQSFQLTRVARSKCIRFDVPPGAPYRLQIASEAPTAMLLASLRWGSPPTREDYDLIRRGPAASFPELTGAAQPGGSAYLRIDAERIGEAGVDVRVALAESGVAALFGMSPGQSDAEQAPSVWVSVHGAGLPEDTALALRPRAGGAARPALEVIRLSASRLDVKFELADAAAGDYDLVASRAAGELAVLPRAFELRRDSPSRGWRVRLHGPGVYRNNSLARLTVQLENSSDWPIAPLLIEVTGPAGSKLGFARDPHRFAETALGVVRAADTPDGSISPGSTVNVPIWFHKKLLEEECSPQVEECRLRFEVRVFDRTPPSPIDWDALAAPAGVSAADWAAARAALRDDLATWEDYRVWLVDRLATWGRRGYSFNSALPAFDLGLRQALGLPSAAVTGVLRRIEDGQPIRGARVVATRGGAAVSFARTGSDGFFAIDRLEPEGSYSLEVMRPGDSETVISEPIQVNVPPAGDLYGVEVRASNAPSGRQLALECPPCESAPQPEEPLLPPDATFTRSASFSPRVISAFDPNEKNGSGTQGGDAEVDPKETIEYRVYFENLSGENGAAARRVDVEDVLPPELDWTTVQLFDVVVNASPEPILISLGGDGGSPAPGAWQDVSSGTGVAVDPSAPVASEAAPFGRARWTGPVAYRAGDDATVELELDIRGIAAPAAEATLDGSEAGVVTWILDATLDRSDPPDSGFLPYGCADNVEDPACGGYVSFTVLPAEDVAPGSEVVNDAEVTFDELETVVTDPPAVVTIEDQLPSVPASPSPTPSSDGGAPARSDGVRLAWESAYADSFELYLWDAEEGASRPASPDAAVVWRTDLLASLYPTLEDALVLPAGRAWRWQVVAKNGRGQATPGPVWDFVTQTVFRRGDADGSGDLQITDAIRGLDYLFLGATTPACLVALDADDSGDVNITDPILVLGYLFIGNATIPAPGPIECGADPSPDLDCASYGACP